MQLKDIIGFLKLAQQEENKKQWRQEMVKNKWKNFFGSLLFCIISAGFFILGYFIRSSFFTVLHWYIWMGLSAIFFSLGVITFFSYCWIIISNKKN